MFKPDSIGNGEDQKENKIDNKKEVWEIFGCQKEQVAYNKDEINQNTKVYIGPLFFGIFSKNIDHIFSSFPEREIIQKTMSIGGKNKEELIKEIEQKNTEDKIIYYSSALDLMKKKEFITLEKPTQINLVFLSLADLGVKVGGIEAITSTKQIYEKFKEFGLELCPPEVAPYLALEQNKMFNIEEGQFCPKGEMSDQKYLHRYPYVAMKPIGGNSQGGKEIFKLGRGYSDKTRKWEPELQTEIAHNLYNTAHLNDVWVCSTEVFSPEDVKDSDFA